MVGEHQKGRAYYRCHTKGCPTRTVTEAMIHQAVRDSLSVSLPASRITELQDSLRNWAKGKESIEARSQRLHLQIAQIDSRQDRLTDALVDGLLDNPTYARRNEALLIDRQKLENQLQKLAELPQKEQRQEKFLELAKSLAWLHEIAKPQEKRILTELATSNRIVLGKNIAVEPSNWCLTAQNAMKVLCGGALRDTDRTHRQLCEQLLTDMELAVNELSVDNLLDQMMAIFDRYSQANG